MYFDPYGKGVKSPSSSTMQPKKSRTPLRWKFDVKAERFPRTKRRDTGGVVELEVGFGKAVS